jgi:glycosyltransferase involved in cell wall biosynthesis
VLVNAYGKIINDIPHKLLIVGKPRPGENKVLRAIEELQDKDRVLRIEYLSWKQLILLYQYADVFVLPSVYEGFGLPVLEALMAGVPVITTRKGSLPEVGGDVALYMETPEDLADKLKEVTGWSKEKRAENKIRAQEWARHFNWRKTAEGTVASFKKVVT